MIGLLLAAATALVTSILGTRILIDWLRRRAIGQPIHEDLPSGHTVKAGTPTMGGVMIVLGAFAGYCVAHLREGVIFTRSGILTILAIFGAGVVGLLDDWLKVSRERNQGGLTKGAKMLGLLGVAVAFAVLAAYHTPVSFSLGFTRFDNGFEIGRLPWIILTILMILSVTNAVNLTDGLDGLAAGSAAFGFICYLIIGFWALTHPAYEIAHSLDLAVVAAAMLGSCTGFLWWNAAPARIIMGDTGSLAIGAGLAAMALMTNTHLLLPVIGGIYVIETMSVIIQVACFRLLKRRVFRIAPIHHHFEQLGWPETTIIIRFWILGAMATAMAVGIFYADYLSIPGAVD